MLRWKYIIPRLGLLGCFGAAIWLLLDPVLRWTLIHGGQLALGSKVEIGEVDTSLARGQLLLSSIAVADPESPMRNLVEVKSAELDMNLAELLHRRVVIDEGRLADIKIASSRVTDGSITPATRPDQVGRGGAAAEKWLHQMGHGFGERLAGDLQTVRLGRELRQTWPAAYQQLEADTRTIQARAERLAKLIAETRDNPARPLDHYQGILVDAESLRSETLELQARIAQLQHQMQIDRDRMRQAQQHDLEYIRRHTQLAALDPEAVSTYLLGPEMGSRVATLMQWLKWSRRGNESADPQLVSRRGQDISLPGMSVRPDFLIRKLELDGTGTVDNQLFTFSGTAHGITGQPAAYGRPTRLQIETAGEIQGKLVAIVDRTKSIPHDQIRINCPTLKQPRRKLGSSDGLTVTIPEGTASLVIDLDLADDALDGAIAFHQAETHVETAFPESVDKLASQYLATAASRIQDVQAEILLSGSLEKPTWKLESNLGAQLAEGLNAAVQAGVEQQRSQLMAKANQEVEQHLSRLQTELTAKQDALLAELKFGDQQLEHLMQQLSGLHLPKQLSDKLFGDKGVLDGLFRR